MGFWEWPAFYDDLARLGAATLLGGALGLEREWHGHWAGLRTHIMVALGAAIFVIGGTTAHGQNIDGPSRVIQGVASGIGFLGAGTILTTDQADRAIDAGAKFLVTPGTNPKVIEHVLKRGLPIVPGVATPSEIELATSLGAEVLKFFPAETMGGVAALKAFAGPYPDARFIPTGGITPELLPGYLQLPSVVACGGSWMAPRELLAAGRFDAIAALVEDAKKILSGPPEIAT